jgi:hypothetical protein
LEVAFLALVLRLNSPSTTCAFFVRSFLSFAAALFACIAAAFFDSAFFAAGFLGAAFLGGGGGA